MRACQRDAFDGGRRAVPPPLANIGVYRCAFTRVHLLPLKGAFLQSWPLVIFAAALGWSPLCKTKDVAHDLSSQHRSSKAREAWSGDASAASDQSRKNRTAADGESNFKILSVPHTQHVNLRKARQSGSNPPRPQCTTHRGCMHCRGERGSAHVRRGKGDACERADTLGPRDVR